MSRIRYVSTFDRNKWLYGCDAYMVRVDSMGYLLSPWFNTHKGFLGLMTRTTRAAKSLNSYKVLISYVKSPVPKIVFVCKVSKDGRFSDPQLKKISEFILRQDLFFELLAKNKSDVVEMINEHNNHYYIGSLYVEGEIPDKHRFGRFHDWPGAIYYDCNNVF